MTDDPATVLGNEERNIRTAEARLERRPSLGAVDRRLGADPPTFTGDVGIEVDHCVEIVLGRRPHRDAHAYANRKAPPSTIRV